MYQLSQKYNDDVNGNQNNIKSNALKQGIVGIVRK